MPIEERSAGAVIYYIDDKARKYITLHYTSGHWDFPKGNIEEGETEVKTTLREVEEETGIRDLALISGFRRKIEYHYMRGGKLVHKEVVFHLAEAKTSEVRLSHEHTDYAWLAYPEAMKRLTFKTARSILKGAEKFLSSPRHEDTPSLERSTKGEKGPRGSRPQRPNPRR